MSFQTDEMNAFLRDVRRQQQILARGAEACEALRWLHQCGEEHNRDNGFATSVPGFDKAKPYRTAALREFAGAINERAIELAEADVAPALAAAAREGGDVKQAPAESGDHD